MIEMRQLRYFARTVELGSLSRAANDLRVVPSALSQQISKLEEEIGTQLLDRSARGVTPTAAGLEFYREAQLSLRHAEQAASVAQQARRSGRVSIGLPPSTANVLGTPIVKAMWERNPEVHLHLLEATTGQLSLMLNARQLDLAVLFDIDASWRWNVTPIAVEKVYLIQRADDKLLSTRHGRISLQDLGAMPLILSSPLNGSRRAVNAAFTRAGIKPSVVLEIDSLGIVLDAVEAGLGATLQVASAIARTPSPQRFRMTELNEVVRVNSLCYLSEDELPAPALAVRTVVIDCAREVIATGRWAGVTSSLRA